jgi:hypothetical protein
LGYQIVVNPVLCHLLLIKRIKKHRVLRPSTGGARVATEHEASKRSTRTVAAGCVTFARPPAATQIVDHFATRMQIEEAFRDLKSARYGMGFELNRSRSRERLAALLLIALLSFFVLWLIGQAALARNLQFRYQSNTRRARPVHSLFNLACLIVRRAIDQQLPCNLPRLPTPIRSPLPPPRGI